jgi:hypothetical protein
MNKILTGITLAIITLPVSADDTPQAPAQVPQMNKPIMQAPQMAMPNINMPSPRGNNGSNWNMPNMHWGNGSGYNNGSSWNMPNMNWGNGAGNGLSWNMPNMNWGNRTGNGSSWNMPSMNWGNGYNSGSGWNMPNMNWGNNNPYNRGTAMSMPNMNWGNNSGGWNRPNMGNYGTPMYMAAPIAPQVPIMQPPQPGMRMIAPTMPPVVSPAQIGNGAKTQAVALQPTQEKTSVAADIVKQKIEEMQELNKSIAKKLAEENQKKIKVEAKADAPVIAQQKAIKEGVKVEAKADAPVVAEQKAEEQKVAEQDPEKGQSATDAIKQKIQQMKDLTAGIAKKITAEDKKAVEAAIPVTAQ